MPPLTRIVVQQCRANRHGAAIDRGVLDLARSDHRQRRYRRWCRRWSAIAVQRQRRASVNRKRRVGVGQRIAAQRRRVDHLQLAILCDRAAANAGAAFELHRCSEP